MNAFEIRGGKPLKGEITPQGAKNEALQILCAVLLTSEKVTISNIPDIALYYRITFYIINIADKLHPHSFSRFGFKWQIFVPHISFFLQFNK